MPALAECLARAFETDPVLRYLMPDANHRAREAPRFYRAVLDQFSGIGTIHTDPELGCAAIWQEPDARQIGVVRQAVFSMRMLAILRGRALQGYALLEEMERVHFRGPHWYLALIGTDPERQGSGLGSALLSPVLRRCDREGLPAYLESSKETNIPYYRRYGFEVVDELRIEDGPVLWPMVRKPKL